jgi:hypothetical protein
VTVYSYNMHGLNQGQSLLSDICRAGTAPIIFVQEHWQTPANIIKIINFSPDYSGFGVSAMEQAVSTSVLRGRPFGGVATLVHNNFLSRVACLKCADRFTVILFGHTIFINVYLPCCGTGSDLVLEATLTDIRDVISLYQDYDIVLGGDLNTDM